MWKERYSEGELWGLIRESISTYGERDFPYHNKQELLGYYGMHGRTEHSTNTLINNGGCWAVTGGRNVRQNRHIPTTVQLYLGILRLRNSNGYMILRRDFIRLDS
jgi:hypothetical protein